MPTANFGWISPSSEFLAHFNPLTLFPQNFWSTLIFPVASFEVQLMFVRRFFAEISKKMCSQ
jgi:hypothetical protein